MVREANVKQANAEKQLKEAQGKVRTNTAAAFIMKRLFFDVIRSTLLSSDRRPPGGGPGPEDPGALLPHLPRGRAPLGGGGRSQDPLQERPQPEQEHVLGRAGDAARPVRHAAHRPGVSGGGRGLEWSGAGPPGLGPSSSD